MIIHKYLLIYYFLIDGGWQDSSCSYSGVWVSGYICESSAFAATPVPTKEPTIAPTTVAPTTTIAPTIQMSCPNGYTYNSLFNNCHKFNVGQLTWYAANDQCLATGGWLYTVNSQAKTDFIRANFPQTAWIGYFYNNGYHWYHGEPLNGYSKWCPNEPNGGTGQQCIYIECEGN